MAENFFPSNDAELLLWSGELIRQLGIDPCGVSDSLAGSFVAVQARYAAASASAASSPSAAREVEKGSARESMKAVATIVSNRSTGSTAQRVTLGFGRQVPSPTAAEPSDHPAVTVELDAGRSVIVGLTNRVTGSAVQLPTGTTGAAIFSFIGDVTPTSIRAWQFEMLTPSMRTSIDLSDAPAGATVWITAGWIEAGHSLGPVAIPVSTRLAGGAARPLGRTIQRAA